MGGRAGGSTTVEAGSPSSRRGAEALGEFEAAEGAFPVATGVTDGAASALGLPLFNSAPAGSTGLFAHATNPDRATESAFWPCLAHCIFASLYLNRSHMTVLATIDSTKRESFAIPNSARHLFRSQSGPYSRKTARHN